jgi:hypothetical protein
MAVAVRAVRRAGPRRWPRSPADIDTETATLTVLKLPKQGSQLGLVRVIASLFAALDGLLKELSCACPIYLSDAYLRA